VKFDLSEYIKWVGKMSANSSYLVTFIISENTLKIQKSRTDSKQTYYHHPVDSITIPWTNRETSESFNYWLYLPMIIKSVVHDICFSNMSQQGFTMIAVGCMSFHLLKLYILLFFVPAYYQWTSHLSHSSVTGSKISNNSVICKVEWSTHKFCKVEWSTHRFPYYPLCCLSH
jgi:hypothetical protein